MDKSRSFPEYSSCGELESENRGNAYSFNGPNATPPSDPELKRRKRIAAYNMFTTERKLKSTMRERLKWIKNKFTDVRYSF